ncbi:MAG: hypothetical protein WD872_12975 [Pirellulaceae bacterium]
MSNPFPSPQQPSFYQEPPRSSGSGCGWGLLIGCLGMVVVSLLVCAGVAIYVQQNFDKWAAGFARQVIVAMIEESEIPAGEKAEVIAQVDRVVDAYKARQIDSDDLEQIMTEIGESPVFSLIGLWGMEKQYLDPSGLSPEEKAQGRRAFERALRGVYEKKISQEELQSALNGPFTDVSAILAESGDEPANEPPAEPPAPEATDVAPAEVEPAKDLAEPPAEMTDEDEFAGEQMTDEQVRAMIARLKKLADEASIPDEPFTIDIGDEVKQAVDAALAKKAKQ